MFVLYTHTFDDTTIYAYSENLDQLIEKLKEMAYDYATEICGYDKETVEGVFGDSLREATTFWSDEDEEYPWMIEIQSVERLA